MSAARDTDVKEALPTLMLTTSKMQTRGCGRLSVTWLSMKEDTFLCALRGGDLTAAVCSLQEGGDNQP